MGEEKYINQTACECLSVFFSLCDPVFCPSSAKEIELLLGLKADKAYRHLKTLEHVGMVRKVGDRWEVAPRIVTISDGFKRHIAQQRAEIDRKEREYLG